MKYKNNYLKIKVLHQLTLTVGLLFVASCTQPLNKGIKYIAENNYLELTDLLNNNDFNDDEIQELLKESVKGYHFIYNTNNEISISIEERKIISLLISKSKNPNINLENGTGIIFWAIIQKDLEIFRELINHDLININFSDNNKNYLANYPLNKLNENDFNTLVDKGLNICIDDFKDLSETKHPLYDALSDLSYERIQKLLSNIDKEQISKLNWNPMDALFRRYNNQYLQNQEELNRKLYFVLKTYGIELNSIKDNGRTLLHNAVDSGDIVILEDIITSGVDVNSKIDGEYTAYFYAVLRFGAGPGRNEKPVLAEITELFDKYGYIHIDY